MDTKQHGSGPWRVERRDPYRQFAVLDANDREVVVVLKAEDHSTTKGIAAKVAAAPELYGALCDALEKLELAADMIDNGWDWLAGEIDAAQEAIDKALNTRFEP